MLKNEKSANRIEHQNRKTDQKNIQNRKSQCPPPPGTLLFGLGDSFLQTIDHYTGHPLISMKWAFWMSAVGIWSGKDLFILSWTVKVRLTVSTGSSLAVLFGMVGATDAAFVHDGISEPGEPTTLVPINSQPDDYVDAGLDLITILSEWITPKLINMCTYMHIFLALSCFPLAKLFCNPWNNIWRNPPEPSCGSTQQDDLLFLAQIHKHCRRNLDS